MVYIDILSLKLQHWLMEKTKAGRKLLATCLFGYKAKLINVGIYSFGMIISCLTIAQLMLDERMSSEPEDLTVLCLFLITTFTGSIGVLFKKPWAIIQILMGQLTILVTLISVYVGPELYYDFLDMWDLFLNRSSHDSLLIWLARFIIFGFLALMRCLPITVSTWFSYCSLVVLLNFLGYRMFEDQDDLPQEYTSSDSDDSEYETALCCGGYCI